MIGILALLIVFNAGSGDDEAPPARQEVEGRSATSKAQEGAPAKGTPASSGLVTSEELGERWPFTVGSGHVECLEGGTPVFRTGGTTYALTGYGATNLGFPEIDPIWRDNPNIEGVKISLTPITDRARDRCD